MATNLKKKPVAGLPNGVGIGKIVIKEVPYWRVRLGKSCVAISPVWSEVHAFTREVRHRLKGTKVLHGEEVSCTTISSLQLTRESRNQVETYQPGDVLMFHRAVGPFEKHEAVRVRPLSRC